LFVAAGVAAGVAGGVGAGAGAGVGAAAGASLGVVYASNCAALECCLSISLSYRDKEFIFLPFSISLLMIGRIIASGLEPYILAIPIPSG